MMTPADVDRRFLERSTRLRAAEKGPSVGSGSGPVAERSGLAGRRRKEGLRSCPPPPPVLLLLPPPLTTPINENLLKRETPIPALLPVLPPPPESVNLSGELRKTSSAPPIAGGEFKFRSKEPPRLPDWLTVWAGVRCGRRAFFLEKNDLRIPPPTPIPPITPLLLPPVEGKNGFRDETGVDGVD